MAARNGKRRIAGKAGTVLPLKGLAKEEGKGDEKDFSLLEMRGDIPEKSANT